MLLQSLQRFYEISYHSVGMFGYTMSLIYIRVLCNADFPFVAVFN